MGIVHEAHDSTLGRRVALKEMLRSTSTAWARRFSTEARVTAQLDHPNIVPVYDADLGEGDTLAYSMKLVSGATLTEVLEASAAARRAGGKVPDGLSLERLLGQFAKMCDAIAYAHDKGVVHRDLKPDNVMIGAHGEVYVMDWGLARVAGAVDVLDLPGSGNATLPGYALGTASYMAPEQATGKTMGPACDQYALGLVLYEMVCGRPARPQGVEVQEALERAASGVLLPVVALPGAHVRRELTAIIRRATKLQPEARYPSVRALADDVRRYRANLPVAAAPDTRVQRAQRWLSRHREATLRLVLALLLGLIGAGAALTVTVLGGAAFYASWAQAQEERFTGLVTHIGSRAAELEHALTLIHAQVGGTSAASQALLEHGEIDPDVPLYAPSAFAHAGSRPADTAHSASYDRPISTTWPDMVIAPDGDRALSVRQARQLAPVRAAMRRSHIITRRELEGLDEAAAERSWRDQSGPIRFAMIGTPAGLYLEMPGAAWDVAGFDPRVRPWYTLATSTTPTWTKPYQEASSGMVLIPCSMQIPSSDGGILGVASLSVSFGFLRERYLMIEHPAVEETFIVDREGLIIMRSTQAAARGRHTHLDETFHTPPFPDPALAPSLSAQAGILHGVGGKLYLHYPLSNGWWFVAQVDPAQAASVSL